MSEDRFPFEDLEVWQAALDFADHCLSAGDCLCTDRNHYRLMEQLESSCTSISLNIAEGKGRYSKKEFVHFLYIARGSLYETITLLYLFRKRAWLEDRLYASLKSEAISLGKRLTALIKAIKT